MAYTNSSLVTYKKISPNKTSPRNHVIDTITIHCIVGQWTAKQGCDFFANSERKCSANYVVGKDGSIGLSVEEKDRSWCSSSSSNDNRAITIEVASDTISPYAVTDKALFALIELIADVCKRNNIKQLKWKGDKSLIGQVDKQNMTVHRWFANKDCPGAYLYNKHPYIVNEVNKKLGILSSGSSATNIVTYSPAIKTLVDKGIINSPDYWEEQKDNLKYLSNLLEKLSKVVQAKKLNSFNNVKDAINHLVKCNVIDTPTYWMANYSKIKYLDTLIINAANHIKSKFHYIVRVTEDALNVRKGAGTNYDIVTTIRDKGAYTIVDEAMNGSTKWGLLKSYEKNRNGWISLKYTKQV